MDLSIIIVNYNTREDLKNCLNSIGRARGNLKLQVIVIDNRSNDESAAMVAGAFPWVKLIANSENCGFVAANNQGIRHAKGRYILLLNPDTIVFEDTLEKSVEYMGKRPDVGALGIRTLTKNGNVFPNGNTFPSEIKTLARLLMLREILPNKWIRKRLPHIMGKVASAYADREQEREVDMVGGFYLFLRADAVRQAGELEEAYWADIEDSDYCCMLKKAGWKVVYWPGASMIHLIGSSIERRTFSLDTYLRVNENTMLFFKRHYPARRLLALRAIYVFGVLPQILIAFLLPVCLGSKKAQTFTRIKGALGLAKSALILPRQIRYTSYN